MSEEEGKKVRQQKGRRESSPETEAAYIIRAERKRKRKSERVRRRERGRQSDGGGG